MSEAHTEAAARYFTNAQEARERELFTQGAEWERHRLLNRLTLLADGFHFAGRFSAEKALRAFIGTEEKS